MHATNSPVHAKDGSTQITSTMQQAAVDPQLQLLDSIATTGFTSTQQSMLSIVKAQYKTYATSFDSTVLQYADGNEEPWCADFISWVRLRAGIPFVAPETGYWRIPGVDTLQAYYQTYGMYHDLTAGDTYTPELGDVAFYAGQTPDGESSAHVALILSDHDGRIITIGGNEGGGEGAIQVRDDLYQVNEKGLTGVGETRL